MNETGSGAVKMSKRKYSIKLYVFYWMGYAPSEIRYAVLENKSFLGFRYTRHKGYCKSMAGANELISELLKLEI